MGKKSCVNKSTICKIRVLVTVLLCLVLVLVLLGPITQRKFVVLKYTSVELIPPNITGFAKITIDPSRFDPQNWTSAYDSGNNQDPKFYAPIKAEGVPFLENSAICEHHGKDLKVLIGVKSDVTDPTTRFIARSTWAKDAASFGAKVVFIVGNSHNASILNNLAIEKYVTGDIVHGNFYDSYYNLTLKSMLFYRFALEFCPHVPRIVKLDDDVVVNIKLLLNVLSLLPENSMAGHTQHAGLDPRPIRYESKWNVPMTVYPFEKYPMFFPGTFIMMDSVAARKIYEASLRMPYFHLDDVYESGMLTSVSGTDLLDASSLINYSLSMHMCDIIAIVHIPRNNLFLIWKIIEANGPKCN